MKVPENVLNPVLYKRAYEKVRGIYGDQTSAYRSMAIVTEYKKMGGQYRSANKPKQNGVTRWLRERWIMVQPYLTEKKAVPCGTRNRREHACRPLVRVHTKTPITIDEAIQKHGQAKVARLARSKRKYCSERVRIDWNQGTIKKSSSLK